MAENKSGSRARRSLRAVRADQGTGWQAAVNAFQDVFVEAMQSGEGLKLTGLFSAERVKRAARTGRNPRTGETIEIPATYGVRISAGSLLKKAVTK